MRQPLNTTKAGMAGSEAPVSRRWAFLGAFLLLGYFLLGLGHSLLFDVD